MPTVLMVMLLRVRELRDHVREAADAFEVFSVCSELLLCGEVGVSAAAVHASHCVYLLRNS